MRGKEVFVLQTNQCAGVLIDFKNLGGWILSDRATGANTDEERNRNQAEDQTRGAASSEVHSSDRHEGVSARPTTVRDKDYRPCPWPGPDPNRTTMNRSPPPRKGPAPT